MVSTIYLDTSALVKRYIAEEGSDWIKVLLDGGRAPASLTSHLTVIEAVCTFARRRREGLLSAEDYLQVLAALDYDFEHRYGLIAVEPVVMNAARQMAERNPLRAYDAVQLASAWLANERLGQAGREPLTFISADDRLLAIAQIEGLLTANPNHHP